MGNRGFRTMTNYRAQIIVIDEVNTVFATYHLYDGGTGYIFNKFFDSPKAGQTWVLITSGIAYIEKLFLIEDVK
jgi:hypothetical protein